MKDRHLRVRPAKDNQKAVGIPALGEAIINDRVKMIQALSWLEVSRHSKLRELIPTACRDILHTKGMPWKKVRSLSDTEAFVRVNGGGLAFSKRHKRPYYFDLT